MSMLISTKKKFCKICCLLLSLIIFRFLTVDYALAENTDLVPFELSGWGMSISLQKGSIVMTQNDVDKWFLAGLGVSEEEWKNYMVESDIYLYAVPTSYPIRYISVQVKETDGVDFYKEDSESLETNAQMLAGIANNYGQNIERYEVFSTSMTPYVLLWDSAEDTGECVMCVTIYDGKYINLTYGAYTGQLSEDDEQLVYRILEAVAYEDTNVSGVEEENIAAWGEQVYEMPEVPMILHISEDNMNIYTQDTPIDSKSLERTIYGKDRIDLYTKMSGASYVITHEHDEQLDYTIKIRVKDGKYPQLPSWIESDDATIDTHIQQMFQGSINGYTIYRTETGVFAALDLDFDKNGFRYATIYNGDIIYIQAKRSNGPMTDEDYELLKIVVDSIEFLD